MSKFCKMAIAVSVKRYLILAIIILCFSYQAQADITGCVIFEDSGAPRLGGNIYTSGTGGYTKCNGYDVEIFNSSPSTGPINTICYTNPLGNASPPKWRNCVVGTQCGIIITLIECPVDNYLGYLMPILSIVGVLYIKRKQP